MRITFVQHGDFRDAVRRFDQGLEDNYLSQRYSVDYVIDLVRDADDVTVINIASDPYEETLECGVHTIGLQLHSTATFGQLIDCIDARKPTHFIPRSPMVPLIRWGLRNKVRTLPLSATSFPKGGPRTWLQYRTLARLLNRPEIELVTNHQVESCRDLVRIGVNPDKVVPWDFPAKFSPASFEAKASVSKAGQVRCFYAGRIIETKGVGECVAAVRMLVDRGVDVAFTFAGRIETNAFHELARSSGIEDRVQFLGSIPHSDVLKMMHDHDITVVPSRHTYPEGLPFTIYDSYCSRSPLVASDHPMFRSRVIDNESALIFRAGDAADLAGKIVQLAEDSGLYARLSHNSAEAWERLQIPVVWGEMLDAWIAGGPALQQLVGDYSLGARAY